MWVENRAWLVNRGWLRNTGPLYTSLTASLITTVFSATKRAPTLILDNLSLSLQNCKSSTLSAAGFYYYHDKEQICHKLKAEHLQSHYCTGHCKHTTFMWELWYPNGHIELTSFRVLLLCSLHYSQTALWYDILLLKTTWQNADRLLM